jgi:hypothetical protein
VERIDRKFRESAPRAVENPPGQRRLEAEGGQA